MMHDFKGIMMYFAHYFTTY